MVTNEQVHLFSMFLVLGDQSLQVGHRKFEEARSMLTNLKRSPSSKNKKITSNSYILGHHFELATFLCPSPFRSTWFYVESTIDTYALGFNVLSVLTKCLANESHNLKLSLPTIKNRKNTKTAMILCLVAIDSMCKMCFDVMESM